MSAQTTDGSSRACPNCGAPITALVRPDKSLEPTYAEFESLTRICHIGRLDESDLSGYRVVHG